MEAFRFGFAPDTPPAFKFDPTDDNIVAHYLLPRALGIPNPPFAHAVLDANPASFPPPELLARHGHANSHHAFFLDVTTSNGGRRERVINGRNGGTWRGQQGQYFTLTLLSPGGGEVDIKYKRYDLTFKKFDEDDDDEQEDVKGKNKRKRKDGTGGTPSGWVMHEYTIVHPPLQNTVLSRIHLTKAKIKEDQLQAADFNQHHHLIPAPQQLGQSYYQDDFPQYQEQHPGPSYYYHDFPYQVVQAGPSHHQDFPYQGQAGPSTGFSDGGQADNAPCFGEHFPYHEQAGPSYQGFPVPEQPGPSYYHHPADGGGKAEDASFYGEEIPYQQHAPPSYQGFPMHEQPAPTYYHHPADGSVKAEDGEKIPHQQHAAPSYQGFPMPEQPVPSYYHHPANVMAGGEGFSDGIQADDASFYADNGDGAEDGFVNLLCAGEGLTDHKTAYGDNCEDGFQSTSGGNIECAHGLSATQETFPPKPDS